MASVSTSGVLPTAIPRARGRLEVDVVVADRVVGDRPQLRAAVEQLRVDPVDQQRQQALRVGRALSQLARGSAAVRLGHRSTSCAARRRSSAGPGQLAGDEAARHGRRILAVRRMYVRTRLCAAIAGRLCAVSTAASAPAPRPAAARAAAGPARTRPPTNANPAATRNASWKPLVSAAWTPWTAPLRRSLVGLRGRDRGQDRQPERAAEQTRRC